MSEQDRYGYDSASHPSHQDPPQKPPQGQWSRKKRWTLLTLLCVVLIAAAFASLGCISLPSTPPQPPATVPTTLPTPEPTATPTPEPPPHPCQWCLDQGYPLCNQEPDFLKHGCCDLPPGQDCSLIPPAAPPPSVPPAPAPPTPAPTPVPQPGICGAVMPAEPVRVDTGKVEGLLSFPAGTMKVARSSCPAGGLHPNGVCFPDEIYQRTGIELAPSESQCFEIAHNLSGAEVVRGMACEGPDPQGQGSYKSGDKQAVQRGCADAYGRRVKEQPFGSGKWVLTAHRGPGGELLSDPEVSWTYFGLCPPLSTQPCMAPPPEPPSEPPPTSEPIDGMGITIVIRCAGNSLNCGVQEVTGPEVDTGRVFRAPLRQERQGYTLDASYYLNRRGNKIHNYDPRFPGPLTDWREDVLSGDHIDCSDFWDHPEGMTITCRGVAAPEPGHPDQGYANGTRNRWTACNAQGLCGSVTLEVLP